MFSTGRALLNFFKSGAARSSLGSVDGISGACCRRQGILSMPRESIYANPVVYSCIRYIARNLGSVGLVCEQETHALCALLRQPNPQHTQSEFLESVVSSYLLHGNAYILVIKDRDTCLPCELRVLSAENVQPVCDKYGCPHGYKYTAAYGEKHFIEYETKSGRQIIHIKVCNPWDEFTGHSPIEIAHKTARQMELFENYHAERVTTSMSKLRGIFTYRGNRPLTPIEHRKLTDTIENTMENGTALVFDQAIEYRHIPEARGVDEYDWYPHLAKTICQIFGVPPLLLGVEHKHYQGQYQEARKQFWYETAIPILRTIMSAFNNTLVRLYTDAPRVEINSESLPDCVRPQNSDQQIK